jgi:hypothetical protein
MTTAASATHPHEPIRTQLKEFFLDFEHELERETLPAHDSSQADLVVRKHVDGLAIALFSLVALFLLGAIVAIGFIGQ